MNTIANKIDLNECVFCQKRFVNVLKFNKHTCKYTKRAIIIDTPEFKSAFFLYKKWRKLTAFPCKHHNEFIKSKYFISFIKFSEFNERYGLPDLNHYFKYMQTHSPLPTTWCNEDLYLNYIEYFDSTKSNDDLLELSMQTIHKLQNIFQCDINQTLFNLNYMELVRLISSRKLSPIFLLLWRPFYVYIATKITTIEKSSLLCIMDCDKWRKYFKNNVKDTEIIKHTLHQYGLD